MHCGQLVARVACGFFCIPIRTLTHVRGAGHTGAKNPHSNAKMYCLPCPPFDRYQSIEQYSQKSPPTGERTVPRFSLSEKSFFTHQVGRHAAGKTVVLQVGTRGTDRCMCEEGTQLGTCRVHTRGEQHNARIACWSDCMQETIFTELQARLNHLQAMCYLTVLGVRQRSSYADATSG